MKKVDRKWIVLTSTLTTILVCTSGIRAEDDLPPPPTDETPAAESLAPPPPAVSEAFEAPPRRLSVPVDVSSTMDKAAAAAANEASGANLSKSEASTNLDHFMASKNTTDFTGRPIDLQFRDLDVAVAFQLISEASGFNIILGDDVKGKLTMNLVGVPWDQALDVILHTLRLGAERNNNILRIMTLANMTTEKQELLKAQRAAEASTPKITKVFPISYATLADLSATIQKFVSVPGATASDLSGTPAAIQADNRTNSLIVRDLPDNIERVRKLIDVLDTQTPQVLIESKVVEASEGFTRNITGSLGAGGTSTGSRPTTILGSIGGGDPTTGLTSIPTGSNVSSLGFAPTINFIGLQRLNALLSLTESENKSKTIASPRFVVMNKQAATITQSTPVSIASSSVSQGVVTTGVTISQANLTMTATPTVTNDGSVLLQLNLSRDVPQSAAGAGGTAVSNRNMNTQVLVESGSTLVLGGIYTSDNTTSEGGFPVLRDIPILGYLFGNKSATNSRTELFFFITPRILNPKEAGLSG